MSGLLAAPPAQAIATNPNNVGGGAAAVKIDIADGQRACTGALVLEDLVITAASCFTERPGAPLLRGTPAMPVKAWAGTNDLATAQARTIVHLEPAPGGRDLVLARLNAPVTGASTLYAGAGKPAFEDVRTVTGWGRTATEAAPTRSRYTGLMLKSIGATDMTARVNGVGDSLCDGDKGAALTWSEPGHTHLAGIVSGFGQAGCLGGPSTGSTDVVVTRTDNAAPWIRSRLFYGDAGSTSLAAGGRLEAGSMLYATGKASLIMQADGNLVQYAESGAVLWASGTYGNPGAYAVLQGDGNFVVYKKDGGEGRGGALWSSGTWGNPGGALKLQDDHNLVVYRQDGSAAWSTGTWSYGSQLSAGQKLAAGQLMGSFVAMEQSGTLTVRDPETYAVLGSYPGGWNPGAYAVLQADGNFVVYKKDGGEGKGGALWSTGTWGNPGARLVAGYGNLTLYKNDSNDILWQSGPGR
ncbi:trypsin-like serine protease [Streptomyces sp. NPDC091371]|uniref:trypsin-like serine protease n=1 Tax=Streptomyces sp. NPDC091371 TaxID=3155303 RepID=UPI0034346FE1